MMEDVHEDVPQEHAAHTHELAALHQSIAHLEAQGRMMEALDQRESGIEIVANAYGLESEDTAVAVEDFIRRSGSVSLQLLGSNQFDAAFNMMVKADDYTVPDGYLAAFPELRARVHAVTQNNLGLFYHKTGKFESAEAHLQRAHQAELGLGDTAENPGGTLVSLAAVHADMGKLKSANATLKQAEAMIMADSANPVRLHFEEGNDEALLIHVLTQRGNVLERLGDYADAAAQFKRAADRLKKIKGAAHGRVHDLTMRMRRCQERAGRLPALAGGPGARTNTGLRGNDKPKTPRIVREVAPDVWIKKSSTWGKGSGTRIVTSMDDVDASMAAAASGPGLAAVNTGPRKTSSGTAGDTAATVAAMLFPERRPSDVNKEPSPAATAAALATDMDLDPERIPSARTTSQRPSTAVASRKVQRPGTAPHRPQSARPGSAGVAAKFYAKPQRPQSGKPVRPQSGKPQQSRQASATHNVAMPSQPLPGATRTTESAGVGGTHYTRTRHSVKPALTAEELKAMMPPTKPIVDGPPSSARAAFRHTATGMRQVYDQLDDPQKRAFDQLAEIYERDGGKPYDSSAAYDMNVAQELAAAALQGMRGQLNPEVAPATVAGDGSFTPMQQSATEPATSPSPPPDATAEPAESPDLESGTQSLQTRPQTAKARPVPRTDIEGVKLRPLSAVLRSTTMTTGAPQPSPTTRTLFTAEAHKPSRQSPSPQRRTAGSPGKSPARASPKTKSRAQESPKPGAAPAASPTKKRNSPGRGSPKQSESAASTPPRPRSATSPKKAAAGSKVTTPTPNRRKSGSPLTSDRSDVVGSSRKSNAGGSWIQRRTSGSPASVSKTKPSPQRNSSAGRTQRNSSAGRTQRNSSVKSPLGGSKASPQRNSSAGRWNQRRSSAATGSPVGGRRGKSGSQGSPTGRRLSRSTSGKSSTGKTRGSKNANQSSFDDALSTSQPLVAADASLEAPGSRIISTASTPKTRSPRANVSEEERARRRVAATIQIQALWRGHGARRAVRRRLEAEAEEQRVAELRAQIRKEEEAKAIARAERALREQERALEAQQQELALYVQSRRVATESGAENRRQAIMRVLELGTKLDKLQEHIASQNAHSVHEINLTREAKRQENVRLCTVVQQFARQWISTLRAKEAGTQVRSNMLEVWASRRCRERVAFTICRFYHNTVEIRRFAQIAERKRQAYERRQFAKVALVQSFLRELQSQLAVVKQVERRETNRFILVQSLFRGSVARRLGRRLREEARKRKAVRQHNAAVIIQNFFIGTTSQKRRKARWATVVENLFEHKHEYAATKIQATYRMHLHGRQFREVVKQQLVERQREKRLQDEEAKHASAMLSATAVLQRAYRSHLSRRQLRFRRDTSLRDKIEYLSGEMRDYCAKKLQHFFLLVTAKAELKRRREMKVEMDKLRAWRRAKDDAEALEVARIQLAVKYMQRVGRGFVVRKVHRNHRIKMVIEFDKLLNAGVVEAPKMLNEGGDLIDRAEERRAKLALDSERLKMVLEETKARKELRAEETELRHQLRAQELYGRSVEPLSATRVLPEVDMINDRSPGRAATPVEQPPHVLATPLDDSRDNTGPNGAGKGREKELSVPHSTGSGEIFSLGQASAASEISESAKISMSMQANPGDTPLAGRRGLTISVEAATTGVDLSAPTLAQPQASGNTPQSPPSSPPSFVEKPAGNLSAQGINRTNSNLTAHPGGLPIPRTSSNLSVNEELRRQSQVTEGSVNPPSSADRTRAYTDSDSHRPSFNEANLPAHPLTAVAQRKRFEQAAIVIQRWCRLLKSWVALKGLRSDMLSSATKLDAAETIVRFIRYRRSVRNIRREISKRTQTAAEKDAVEILERAMQTYQRSKSRSPGRPSPRK